MPKIKPRIWLLILVPTLFLSGFIISRELWHWFLAPVSSNTTQQVLVIRRGESTSEIASDLQTKGLIKNAMIFRLYLKKMNLQNKIQAGDFKLSPSLGAKAVAEKLTFGTLDIWITTIEGWRTEEIATKLNKELGIKSESFLQEAKEGYMFPDTYLIPKEATAGAVVNIFQKNFNQKIDDKIHQDIRKTGLTLNEIVILASIVEREAQNDNDRPIVAGILLKRLEIGMALQTDATIQYALATTNCLSREALAKWDKPSSINCDWWPKNITNQDLKIASPFNTYLNPGLPPAPISNPGLAAIKAVVYPQKTNFLYYLSDKNGQMHYAQTIDEHNQNIQKFL